MSRLGIINAITIDRIDKKLQVKDVCMEDLWNHMSEESLCEGKLIYTNLLKHFGTWWIGPGDFEVSMRLTAKKLSNCIKWTLHFLMCTQ